MGTGYTTIMMLYFGVKLHYTSLEWYVFYFLHWGVSAYFYSGLTGNCAGFDGTFEFYTYLKHSVKFIWIYIILGYFVQFKLLKWH